MKGIEIEAKILLDDPTSLIQWLEKSAQLMKRVQQTDYYLELPDHPFTYIDADGLRDANEWLRVRISDRGDSICYKKWHRDEKEGESFFADEIEIDISDGIGVLDLFKKLGFVLISTINKKREEWRYGNFIFDCDVIEGLGFAFEIEFTGEISDPTKGKREILDLLKKIGVRDYRLIERGYPWMQWNLKESKKTNKKS